MKQRSTKMQVSRWLLILLGIMGFGLTGALAQVSGVVYRDFDGDGIRSDTLPVERGIAFVTVRAFVGFGSQPTATTITDATGNYSFPASKLPAGTRVRIEFGDFDDLGYFPDFVGANSGSTVQFLTTPATGIATGLNYPSDYCQPKGTPIRLVVPCFVNGDPLRTTNADGSPIPADKQSANGDLLVSFPYSASGVAKFPDNIASNDPLRLLQASPADMPQLVAVASQVGAVWGTAYQRRTKNIFSAATVKRHTGFGPAGIGGIYLTTQKTVAGVTSYTTVPFVRLDTIGVNVGSDPHTGLLGDKTKPSADAGAMSAVGRIGIGGIELSEDDKTLYFINLKDKLLTGVFIDVPARKPKAADVKTWPITGPVCPQGEFRPWAIRGDRGAIYVGGVCSGETTTPPANPAATQASDFPMLSAVVLRIDPQAASPVFETVLSFPLNFRRGAADLTGGCIAYDHWLPWTDIFPTPCSTNFVMYPQPLLTGIEFDDDGTMIIGFLDRFGHMAGVENFDPNGQGAFTGFTGGDLLRASLEDNGTFKLESNATVGGVTSGSGVGNNQGPGGGEFYFDDFWLFGNPPKKAHDEVYNGSLTLVPGFEEVLTSAFDPIHGVYKAGGMISVSNRTGRRNRGFALYFDEPGTFGKASGLGNARPLCEMAPLEIGNRVWYDIDRDGIQDAAEPGIDDVDLLLIDKVTSLTVGTIKTRNGGQYYFNNSNVTGGLLPNRAYEIRMDTTQIPKLDPGTAANPQPAARRARISASPVRAYVLSPANQTDFGTDADIRDADAVKQDQYAVISLTTGDFGENEHTSDFAVHSCPILKTDVDTVNVCPGDAIAKFSAIIQNQEVIDSVRFVYFDSPQAGSTMYSGGTVLGTAKPDVNGLAVLNNPAIPLTNNTGGIKRLYVYGILYPTALAPSCRPADTTIIQLIPSVSVSAVGGTLTCSTTAVTLKGEVKAADGSPATGVRYAWTGPNNFTANTLTPTVSTTGVYVLTVTNPLCPDAPKSATATVTRDQTLPVLEARGAVLPCATCSARLFANAPGATLLWSGPGGFVSTEAEPEVRVPGFYTVTATGTNGCSVSLRVELTPPQPDPCKPACVPIKVARVR
jgi:hypothetical protein